MTTPIQPQTAITVAPKREIRVVEDDSPAGYMLDTAKFEHCYRVAEAMSRATLLPKHLKGSNQEEAKANCFLVVNQAMAWKLNPFLIMGETYEVQGKLGFQGKLVIAVMNTRAGLREKLRFQFNDKKGDDLEVTVLGRFAGEDEDRTVTVSVGQAKTQNQMWVKDPEQKLIYTGAIRWARRHAPEVVMGVMIEEDMEAIREEAHVAALKQVKSPALLDNVPMPPQPDRTTQAVDAVAEPKKIRKRPTMVEEPLEKQVDPPTPPVQAEPATTPAVPVASQVPDAAPPTPTNEAPESELLKLAAASGVNQEQLTKFLHAEKFLGRGTPPKTKISELSTKMLGDLATWFKTQPSFVKKAQETK